MTTPSRAPSPLSSPLIRPFPPQRDYASLSIKDLLDAREAYHVYLSTLENVVATAIGRYLIHQDDWYATNPPDRPRPPDYPKAKVPRTLENSGISRSSLRPSGGTWIGCGLRQVQPRLSSFPSLWTLS